MRSPLSPAAIVIGLFCLAGVSCTTPPPPPEAAPPEPAPPTRTLSLDYQSGGVPTKINATITGDRIVSLDQAFNTSRHVVRLTYRTNEAGELESVVAAASQLDRDPDTGEITPRELPLQHWTRTDGKLVRVETDPVLPPLARCDFEKMFAELKKCCLGQTSSVPLVGPTVRP